MIFSRDVSALYFSEVYADPPGSDNNREFVEICNLTIDGGGALNLSEFLFRDSASQDLLKLAQWNSSSSCALLVEDGFNWTSLSCSIYTLGSSIGNGLNNGGDALMLFSTNGSLILNSSYGEAPSGLSLHWNHSLNSSWSGSEAWFEGDPSPCFDNIQNNIISNISVNETTNITNNTNNTTSNITGNITNNSTGNSTINDENSTNSSDESLFPFSISLLLPEKLYTNILYENPFRIRNEKYETGMNTTNLTLTTRLCRTHADISLPNNKTERNCTIQQHHLIVKSWKSSGTGTIILTIPGNYTLCSNLTTEPEYNSIKNSTNNNSTNNNSTNNSTKNKSETTCWYITAIDPRTTPCNVSLALKLENRKPFYAPGETLRFRNMLSNGTFPYSIRYRITTFNGKNVRETVTENQYTKRWTPPKRSGIRLYWLENNIIFVACNNTNNGTKNKELIVVVGNETTGTSGSATESATPSITLSAPSKEYKAGSAIPVKLSITKGATRKYSIKLWAERDKKRGSETTTIHVSGDVNLQVPLLIKAGAKSGDYIIRAEGLGTGASTTVKIKGNDKGGEKRAQINSFYTRSARAQSSINLYASIVGNGTLTLYGLNDYAVAEVEDEPWQHAVMMHQGKNLFVLLLEQEGKVVDARTLLLLMNSTDIKVVPYFMMDREKSEKRGISSEKGIQKEELSSKRFGVKKDKMISSEKVEKPLFTGYTTKDQGSGAAPYILGFIGTVVLVIVLKER